MRRLAGAERKHWAAGLRSSEALVLRHCQIVLASARGKQAPQRARQVGCTDQAVRTVIPAFSTAGLAALQRRSRRPHMIHRGFDADHAERLQALRHQSPRTFGKPTSVWTLDLAVEVSFEQGADP